MRTVSLRRRVVVAGVAIVTVVLVVLDLFVYLSLRDHLLDGLEGVLTERARLAQQLAGTLNDEELAARLGGSGVGVAVGGPGAGERVIPPAPPFAGPPAPPDDRGAPVITWRVILGGGRFVILSASTAGVEDTMRRLLLLEVIGTGLGIGLAAVLLDALTRRALHPLDEVVGTARRIAEGGTGERLGPDRTDTELGRMAVAFDEMLDAQETALSAARASEGRSRRFLANAAHQLRTPIAGIQASAEALLRGGEDRRREKLLVNLVRETSRVGRLVGSLLAMARLDAEDPLVRATVDLATLCRAEVDRLAARAGSVDVACRGEGPLQAEVNREAISEALANLLDNALRHAERRVEIVLAPEDRMACIRVADDGSGLPEGLVEQAFDRFVTLDGQGGSGLGLPIARGVARAHGGDLAYEDGAFVMRIPLGANEPPSEPPR